MRNTSRSLQMRRFPIVLILFFASTTVFSQNNKKKILVVPYGRFEFVSKFSLEDIAVQNEIDQSEVFNAYQKAMLNAFNQFKDENFEFVALTDLQLSPYKKYIKYEDGKFEGKQYHAVKMRSFPIEKFSQLLSDNDASFIVFVNWYEIQRSSFSSTGKSKNRYKYSSHFVDYGLYNLFQQQIIGVGKFRVEIENPSDEIAKHKGLRLTELEIAYQQIIVFLINTLNKPITDK